MAARPYGPVPAVFPFFAVFALLRGIFVACCKVVFRIPRVLAAAYLHRILAWLGLARKRGSLKGCTFYEGHVTHIRQQPVHHAFRYAVRYALIDLDSPPEWFSSASPDCLTAAEARAIARTTGRVLLLTYPPSLGYEQNPISVYYCYSGSPTPTPAAAAPPSAPVSDPQAIPPAAPAAAAAAGGTAAAAAAASGAAGGLGGAALEACIAEVTNTPWGERVRFAFAAGQDIVPKPLHVSPFMEMGSTWKIFAEPPGQRLAVTFNAEDTARGHFFTAMLRAEASDPDTPPDAWFLLMPHLTAVWIYWQALLVLIKGVPFISHPKYSTMEGYRTDAAEREGAMKRPGGRGAAARGGGCPAFQWREAREWPWNLGSGSVKAGGAPMSVS